MVKIEFIKVNARILSFIDSETDPSSYGNKEALREMACVFKELRDEAQGI